MAGGYGRPDHRRTLADRVVQSSDSAPMTSGSPARHCFVDGEPALLVEWRRGSGGWEGRVISMVWVDAVGWASVERWLSADRLAVTA